MRMWLVEAELLCNQHLLGEHVEMHMFAGCLARGKSLSGYLGKGLYVPGRVKHRHDELSEEMTKRGMNHASPILPFETEEWCSVHWSFRERNLEELSRRCLDCRRRIRDAGISVGEVQEANEAGRVPVPLSQHGRTPAHD